MRGSLSLLLVASFVLGLLVSCGANDADCDKACRNFFQLHYWQEAEREIAAAPEAEREALRKQKHIDLEERTNKGIQLCMKQCRTAATKEQVACLIAATTPEAAKKCLPE
jgi:hypothetical protein